MKNILIGQYHDVLDQGFVGLIDVMGTDASIVQAARVSYGTGTTATSNDEGLIRYLFRHRHTSPVEMCELKFHIKAPIAIMRQWVRHRTASLNEISGRYSEIDYNTYIPSMKDIFPQSTNNKQGRDVNSPYTEDALGDIITDYVDGYDHSFQTYNKLLDKDVARELSRFVLPLGTYSEMYWKIDLHNLFHFMELRIDEHAQFEIRQFANVIYDFVKELFPIASKAFDDYILNSSYLSKMETALIKEAMGNKIDLGNHEDVTKFLINLGSSKREVTEFFTNFE